MNTHTQTKWIMGLAVALALVVGILIGKGWCNGSGYRYQTMMHQMPNGTMMMGGSMDMDDMMNNMMGGLQGKTGDVFDQAFLKEMIIHHEGAVAMAKQVLATSKRPELIKLANDIISAQTNEIKMMSDWQKSWFK